MNTMFYTSYQYMKSDTYRSVLETEMEKFENNMKENLFPKLQLAQQKKEDGARVASAFLLD